jgi:hydrogenase maturation protease
MTMPDKTGIVQLNLMKRKLIIAYGNPDRQDDGAGWFILQKTAQKIGVAFSGYNDDFYVRLGDSPDFFFSLQLTPEMSDLIKNYDEVCFIDASVGTGSSELEILKLIPKYQFSPLSHHMSPQSLLDITKSMNDYCPISFLLTIPGKDFGFSNTLSSQALTASETAIDWLLDWINQDIEQ